MNKKKLINIVNMRFFIINFIFLVSMDKKSWNIFNNISQKMIFLNINLQNGKKSVKINITELEGGDNQIRPLSQKDGRVFL